MKHTCTWQPVDLITTAGGISEVLDMRAVSESKKSKISNNPVAHYHRMQQSSDAPA